MKTPEEWLADHTRMAVPEEYPETCLELDAEDVLARDIEVLREAAKMRCAHCREGRPFGEKQWFWLHVFKGAKWPCGARDFHDRIAELEAKQ